MRNEDQVAFADFLEGTVRETISLADTKSGVVLAAAAAGLGFILSNGSISNALFDQKETFVGMLSLGALIVFSLAAGASFMAIFPRTKGPKLSLVAFGSVSQFTQDRYLEELVSVTEDEYREHRIRHLHNHCGICAKKFVWLRASMLGAASGYILLSVSVLYA